MLTLTLLVVYTECIVLFFHFYHMVHFFYMYTTIVYISDELHFTLGSVSFIFLLATMHNSYDIVYLELKR